MYVPTTSHGLPEFLDELLLPLDASAVYQHMKSIFMWFSVSLFIPVQ